MAKSPYIKKGSLYQVGDVMHSMLGESDFNDLHGGGWVLMDGITDITGTAYHTLTGQTIPPDARGLVLRGKNNGRNDGNQNPDGDLALGAFQNHNTDSHGHGDGSLSASSSGSAHEHSHPLQAALSGTGTGSNVQANGDNGTVNITGGAHGHTVTGTTSIAGGNETRMKNMTVNVYLKVD